MNSMKVLSKSQRCLIQIFNILKGKLMYYPLHRNRAGAKASAKYNNE